MKSLYYYVADKTISNTQLDFERLFFKDLFFRLSSHADWRETKPQFDLSQILMLQHPLTPRLGFSYSAGVYGTSKPDVHLTHYATDIRLRWRFYDKWAFLEFRPQLVFPRSKSYAYDPYLNLSLEFLLGG